MKAIIGRKIGMTQTFDEAGRMVPVTVISAGVCRVVQKKSADSDGYDAIQVGYEPVREKLANRPRRGHFAKAELPPMRFLREFRGPSDLEVGAEIKADVFEAGEKVDVVGTSKGRGFQGVVKRHGYSGGPATHGSKTGRIPGSIGNSADPSRVIKGTKLPGQMGNKRVTVRNLTVVGIDAEQNLVWVRGAVPGARNSVVILRGAGRKQ
jgi:large subunit ribosomal protein L3